MNSHQFAEQIKALGESFPEAAKRAAASIAIVAAGAVKKSMTEGVSPDGTPFKALSWSRPQGGSKPLLNTGVLRASITAEANDVGVTIRANAPGARLQQEGGTVKPVHAQALTIPISKEAVRAGSARNFPRPLFVLKKKDGGEGSLAEKTKDGKIVVHYLLRKSVTVPARPYLGISAETANRIGQLIAAEMVKIAEAKS